VATLGINYIYNAKSCILVHSWFGNGKLLNGAGPEGKADGAKVGCGRGNTKGVDGRGAKGAEQKRQAETPKVSRTIDNGEGVPFHNGRGFDFPNRLRSLGERCKLPSGSGAEPPPKTDFSVF